ncbi:MAG: mechanosensitive ion channel family protein [Desulfurococcus sp.]|nr:mechanosensitive ion channel family protein [Desulfurococcus sp.]
MTLPSWLSWLQDFQADVIQKVIVALLILAAGYLASKIITRIVSRTLHRLYTSHIAAMVSRIIYYVLLFVVITTFLGSLGIDVSGLIIAGGFAGLVVGIAMQPLLSNLFAGLYIMAEKLVRPGDPVEIGSVSGIVMSTSLMFTRISTWDGVLVAVPNNNLLSTGLKNFNMSVARRLEVKVRLSYNEDAERACQVVRRVLEEASYVLVDPAPVVYVSSLGDAGTTGVTITIWAWVPVQYFFDGFTKLPWMIKKALSDAGIEIPLPQVDVWFRTPLEITGGIFKEAGGVKA